MGLRQRWTSYGISRAHTLVVEVPGWWSTRVAAERELFRRGWQLALSPADADILIVCGEPGDRLAEAVDRVWNQLPGPRAQVMVTRPDVGHGLDQAVAQLADEDHQREDARNRRNPLDDGDGDMDHGDMDHGDMDMAPAGIPLASGGEDRDGLEMDMLHVPLGPVLPDWPAGLVLRCVLHGDVVAEAEVEVLDGKVLPSPPVASALPVLNAAAGCDSAARVLAVAGWDGAAAVARRIRDLLLAEGSDRAEAARQLDRLRSRVTRSWWLRWLLRGLGTLDDDALRSHGLPADARGDVHDRLLAMLARARAELRAEPASQIPDAAIDPAGTMDALPAIVAGLELAAVRLVVASLAPDTSATMRRERTHA